MHVAVDSDRSFQDGLEGAKRSTIASALALPSEEHASANTIVSLQLPIAGKEIIATCSIDTERILICNDFSSLSKFCYQPD